MEFGKLKEINIKDYIVYTISLLATLWILGLVMTQIPVLSGWISVFKLPDQLFSMDTLKLVIGTVIALIANDAFVMPLLDKIIERKG